MEENWEELEYEAQEERGGVSWWAVLVAFVLVVAVLGVCFWLVSPTLSAPKWGDSLGGRQAYSREEIAAGELADQPVINSASHGVIGDERHFVRIAQAGQDLTSAMSNTKTVHAKDGAVYDVGMYVQNDNVGTTALNTRVWFEVPLEKSAKRFTITGTVCADNATPGKCWDTVVLNSQQAFHLEYVPGSARMTSGTGGVDVMLSNSIVNDASVHVGSKEPNGELMGGNQHAVWVYIQVKVVYD